MTTQMARYAVKIKLENGQNRWVKVRDRYDLRLVRSKYQATLLSFDMAGILSEYFWEHFWRDDRYEHRSIEGIKMKIVKEV